MGTVGGKRVARQRAPPSRKRHRSRVVPAVREADDHEAEEIACDGPVEAVPGDARSGVSEAPQGWLDAG